MLKKLRVIIAAVFFVLLTLLFLDFTGVLHKCLGWMAKIQFIPAVLAINVVVIVFLVALTIIFGRIYCSVICPLGIFQDGISRIATKAKGKKSRFNYSPGMSWLRYSVLGIFIIAIIAGISIIVSLFDPYAAYGRMASNFFAPLYRLGNNVLASFAESIDSYAFYSTEVWIKGWITFSVAIITLITVTILAWKNGRTYCNTICPVGTVLGFLSKFSIFKIVIDSDKCTKCKACELGCKASCIDSKTKSVDYSRCVTCFNCIDKCKTGALGYALATAKKQEQATSENNAENEDKNNMSRRNILSIVGTLAVGSALKAQQLVNVDGGLAEIKDKIAPERKTPIVPPGAQSLRNMKNHCTACQLCISACPNNVLRPSNKLSTFMQPEMSFERGYCRPECVECSSVCPTGAIKSITTADKSAISVGHSVWNKDNCIVNTDEVPCSSCESHCPTKAITTVFVNPEDANIPPRPPGFPGNRPPALKTPTINKELCIGCGACEHHCPASPYSAIYVEGNVRHHTI